MDEKAVEQVIQSGLFSSRDEVVTFFYEKNKLRENSLIAAVVRGDTQSVCDLVYPTLLRLRRMAGNPASLDLSSFRSGLN
jgi:hypothetical protein